MSADPRETLAKELAVAAAVTGTELQKIALAAMVEDLLPYPLESAVHAIRRTRRECTRLTLAAVIERIEHADGHPGADEAWALCPMTEDDTVIWTDQMARAFAVARILVEQGDRIGARMAFKDAYAREVDQARMAREPVRWHVSLGHDQAKREIAVAAAVEQRRLSVAEARRWLPAPTTPEGGKAVGQIALDDSALRRRWAELVDKMKAQQTAQTE